MCMLPNKGLRILHVSDLHIDSVEDRGWRKVCHDLVDQEKPDLCVISGDLPRRSPSRKLYEALREHLDAKFPDRVATGEEGEGCPWRWIAVPGNHDRRQLGNFLLSKSCFEKGLRVDADHDRNWKRPWWDPQYPCIVVPLDSNPRRWSFLHFGASLARGVLGEECNRIETELNEVRNCVARHFLRTLHRTAPQVAARYGMNVWGAYDSETVRLLRRIAYPQMGQTQADPVPADVLEEIADVFSRSYMARVVRCVVFHHHPIGVPDVDRGNITHRENYLLLIDSGEFLQAARTNKISLVLHGHKHIPHRIGVTLPGQDTEVIGIVGAGSATHGSRVRCANANLIKISSQGEVEVTLCHLPGGGAVEPKASLQLRTWSQVRTRLAEEAGQCSRISSECSTHDVSVLPWGDAIVTRHMRGLGPSRQGNWDGVQRLEIPINFECFTQIGQVQAACRIEQSELQSAQIACRVHRDTGYSSGQLRGFVEIGLPGGGGNVTLTVTLRLVAFGAFPMNPWQGSFIPRDAENGKDDCYTWRSRIPVRKQLSVALETTGDKTAAATFERPAPMYSRMDGGNDPQEHEQIVVERVASGHRVAFTVRSPIWGSRYGISWKWGHQTKPPKHLRAAASCGLRNDLETEARNIWAGRSSPLQTEIQEVLKKHSRKYEAAVYALVRCRANEPGKLIRIAMANGAQIPFAQLPEMNFGAGVAGRAAYLQETIVWAPCDPDARFDETLADFYFATAESHGHTAIAAVPIPRRQPLAILSVASRREEDSLSATVREALRPDVSQREQACRRLAWIARLADRIEKALNGARFDTIGEPASPAGEGASEPGSDRLYCPVAPPEEQNEEEWSDEAIQPVDPDRIQQRLRQYVVNLDEQSP